MSSSSSSASLPPAPFTRDYRDTSITVWWQPAKLPAGTASVAVEAREFPKPAWARHQPAAGATSLIVGGLFPNATFEFRLVAVAADGSETTGPAAAADTLAAGCVPKGEAPEAGSKKGCTLA